MYSLHGIPTSSTVLKVNSISTFIVRINATLMPSESKIMSTLKKDIDSYGIAETVNVNRGLFSNNYDIAFRIRKGVTFDSLSNILKNSLKISLGLDAIILDLKGEFYEAPSPISYVTTSITKSVSAVPETLSSIKWIAIAGLGIMALFYAGPFISMITKKVNKYS